MIHHAHPINGEKNIPYEIMEKTTRNGNNSIMKIAHELKMKRLAITVSTVSMCGDNAKRNQSKQVYDENDFAMFD